MLLTIMVGSAKLQLNITMYTQPTGSLVVWYKGIDDSEEFHLRLVFLAVLFKIYEWYHLDTP